MSILKSNIAARAKLEAQLPVSGIFRMGTKLMSKAASQNPRVVELYKNYKSGKISSKDAEKQAALLDVKYPFYPTNTQEFNVHPLEIEGGQATVDFLMNQYGEDKGEGRKLYRFPVLFPDVPNGIDGVFKSKFSVPQGAVKYWSEEGEDGKRYCMHREAVDPAKQAGRKKFLRRNHVIRGECNPSTCAEFGSGACRFEGTLHFYVPGLTGAGTIIIKTGSTSAAEDVYLRLDDLYTRCRGRLPNFTPDGQPVFFLTKVKKQMTYFEGAVEKKSEQWVLSLETMIDMSKVMLIEEQTRLALQAPVQPTISPTNTMAPAAWLTQSTQPAKADAIAQIETSVRRGEVIDQSSGEITQQPAQATQGKQDLKKPADLDALEELADAHKINDELIEWADAKFGNGWMDSPERVSSVYSEMQVMLDRLGADVTKSLFVFLAKIYSSEINAKDIAIPYFKMKFNGLRSTSDITSATNHLNDLLVSGAAVAKATMTAAIQS